MTAPQYIGTERGLGMDDRITYNLYHREGNCERVDTLYTNCCPYWTGRIFMRRRNFLSCLRKRSSSVLNCSFPTKCSCDPVASSCQTTLPFQGVAARFVVISNLLGKQSSLAYRCPCASIRPVRRDLTICAIVISQQCVSQTRGRKRPMTAERRQPRHLKSLDPRSINLSEACWTF